MVKKTAQIMFFSVPIMLWLGCILVIVKPDFFNHSRMADMAFFWLFGIFTNPIDLLSILGRFDHVAILLILVSLLLLPLAIWVVWPLAFKMGLTMRSYVYLGFLIVYMLPGTLLSELRYRNITQESNFGIKYPGLRYSIYSPLESLTDDEIRQTISFEKEFENLKQRAMTRHTIVLNNGSVLPVDEKEVNLDWGLRKMLQAPTNGYVSSFQFDKLRRRRPSKRFFYFKIGNNYGKGVVYGNNQARLFLSRTGTPAFGSVKEHPSFTDWLSWYFTADKAVYMR